MKIWSVGSVSEIQKSWQNFKNSISSRNIAILSYTLIFAFLAFMVMLLSDYGICHDPVWFFTFLMEYTPNFKFISKPNQEIRDGAKNDLLSAGYTRPKNPGYNRAKGLHFWYLASITDRIVYPADTDVFKTSSGHLKKVTTSYDQTRRRHDIRQKTSDLRRLEDIWSASSWKLPIYDVLKTSDLRGLEDTWFTSSWRRLIYNVMKTPDLRRLGDIWFKLSWRCPIYDILKTFNLRRLEDVWLTTSWRRL